MKKVITLIIAAVMVFALCACGSTASVSEPSAADTMSLSDMMDTILTDVPDLPAVQTTELDADNFEVYAFVKPADGVTGVVSEALVSAQAHSVVLLRAADSASAATLAQEVETNANPRKWICVEAEKTIVAVNGSTVLLVMSNTAAADAISANFDALWQ